MTIHALVQKLPPEAWDLEADRCGAVDVLGVGTKEQVVIVMLNRGNIAAEAGPVGRSLSGVIRTLSRHRPQGRV
jgi:hypothetical protein